MASSEERIDEPTKEMEHKTKVIQFLGRTTPIILQNDNGPCPLLAICNVLLLKNNLNLSPDIAEVSQEKLLSLVAERLIDSNSNVDNKDAGYVENQQQNIADAIDLLPRLATGIDVNIKFTRIDDFEFTRECAIFDLLDIPLYHGWIVDPQIIDRLLALHTYIRSSILGLDEDSFGCISQDCDAANAIGSKSYNTLMGELVALATTDVDDEQKKNIEEDSIDFAAATTAVLGVPSPSLSRGRSFDDSPRAVSDHHKVRKGDMEEEAELLRAMRLSEDNLPTSVNDSSSGNTNEQKEPTTSNESVDFKNSEPVLIEKLQGYDGGESHKSCLQEPALSQGCNAFIKSANEAITHEVIPIVDLKTEQANDLDQSTSQESIKLVKSGNDQSTSQEFIKLVKSGNVIEETNIDVSIRNGNVPSASFGKYPASSCENQTLEASGSVEVLKQPTSVSDGHIPEADSHGCDTATFSSLSTPGANSDLSCGRRLDDVPNVFNPSADGSEPIYEGEECILESGVRIYEDREPMYEGEVVLAKQGDRSTGASSDTSFKDQISPRQGELIRNFMKNSASQLTIYGLFCLQDGLKERELCVFFRNNHFNTMFKFEGELYILATDQGYINQPDLVWEKLNEVNGDTVFMTGNFKEFKVENHTNNTWDEQNAVASTTDYIASIDNSAQANSSFNSDLQLAIALQQQEFEQPPQRSVQPPPTVTSSSRLITGPQVPRERGRNSSTSSRQETKSSKDKSCIVM